MIKNAIVFCLYECIYYPGYLSGTTVTFLGGCALGYVEGYGLGVERGFQLCHRLQRAFPHTSLNQALHEYVFMHIYFLAYEPLV